MSPPSKGLSGGAYVGWLLLTYLIAGIAALIAFAVVFAFAPDMVTPDNSPLGTVAAAGVDYVVVLLEAVMFFFIGAAPALIHFLLMLLYLGFRVVGPTIERPVLDVLVSGAFGYGLAWISSLMTEDPFDAQVIVYVGTGVMVFLGFAAFRLAQRRQVSNRAIIAEKRARKAARKAAKAAKAAEDVAE